MVTVMFIVIVIVIVTVQFLVFKRITLICEITLICVITLVCVILHVLKNTLKYSLNDALFFFVSSNHSHLPTLLYNPFTQNTILHREPVGGRNCFLGHGVTSGLLNRLLPLLFAVAAKSLGPGVWPLPVCSG